jgi:CheY-like chemotaxis protein
MVLGVAGADVTAVASMTEALAAIEDARPSVVVSDIGMPGGDGYALIRELRVRGLRLPAVAVTAYGRNEDRARSLQAGFQAHVSKPVEPTEITDVIVALVAATPPPGAPS